MPTRFGTALNTMTLAAALAAVANSASPVSAGAPPLAGPNDPAATLAVAARDDYFDPANVSVPAGTTIRWTNLGADTHTVTGDGGAFTSGFLYPGMSYSRTFVTPGTYLYHCQFHRAEGMVGAIVVTGTGGGTAPPSGNLALNKPIHASSSQAGYPPRMAVDGSLATFWASRAFGTDLSALDVKTDLSALDAKTDLSALDAKIDLSAPNVQSDLSPLNFGAEPSVAASEGVLARPINPLLESHNHQWIYVDLQATQPLTQIHMQWTPGRHARTYGVYIYRADCGWCLLGSTSNGDGDDTLTLRSPVSARYVLLGLSYPAMPSGPYELREWQVYGSSAVPGPGPGPGTTNVAFGRPAIASGQQVGFPAGNVTDGGPDTAWRSDQIPAWIYVDFGSVATVDRAVLRWRTGEHASRYTLYAWMGGAWRGVYGTTTGDGGTDSASFSAIQTRYLLLYGAGGPGMVLGLNEFEVYGTPGSGAYPLGADVMAVPVEPMWSVHASPDAARLDALPSVDPLQDELDLGGTDAKSLAPLHIASGDGVALPNPEDSAR